MAARKTPLEKLLEAIDEQVAARGEAALAELDATAKIARLASEARNHGATMPDLAKRVKRMDSKERVLKSISRQALDAMISAEFEDGPKKNVPPAGRPPVRANELLEIVKTRPGLRPFEITKAMGINSSYFFALVTKLMSQGRLRRSESHYYYVNGASEPTGKLNQDALK